MDQFDPSPSANIDPEKISHSDSDGDSLDAVTEQGDVDAPEVSEQDGPDGGNVEKKTSKASVNNAASIPNGGLRAWLQVAGSFFLFFNTW